MIITSGLHDPGLRGKNITYPSILPSFYSEKTKRIKTGERFLGKNKNILSAYK